MAKHCISCRCDATDAGYRLAAAQRILKNNPLISASGLAEMLGVSERTAERYRAAARAVSQYADSLTVLANSDKLGRL